MSKLLTISSSLKFKEQIRSAIEGLSSCGVKAVFPNLDSSVRKEDVDLAFMKQLEREHFESINISNAIYVICLDGYVGTLVSVEIGYAKAQGIMIIFSEQPEDLGLQALADEYVNLDELDRMQSVLES